MLAISQKIQELYDNNEFKLIIIEGDHGYGKSAYANNAIAEVHSDDGIHSNWDLKNFKRFLGYHPAAVLEHFFNMRKREKVFHWDDAGAWLNALDYQDPFVKDFNKYLQVARTDWAAIILTCIDRDDVARKIRNLRHTITVEITKESNDAAHKYRRKAEAVIYYRNKKGDLRWTPQWDELFNCKMPDSFYNWYQPLRRKYARMAKQLMKESLSKRKDIKAADIEMKYYEDSSNDNGNSDDDYQLDVD